VNAANVAHGQEICEAFAAAGFNFVQLSYRNESEEKESVIADFTEDGTKIDGLVSVGVLSRGFNVTDIQCGIDARPLRKAFSDFIQKIGRVQRAHVWPDGRVKQFGLWLDHASNVARFRDEMIDLFENGVTSLADPPDAKPPRKELTKKEKEQMFCPKCKRLWEGGDTCSCGFKRKKKVSLMESVAGHMVEVDMTGKKGKASMVDKQQFYSELIGHCQAKGYQSGWAAHQYREKFGVWPRNMADIPAPPTSLVSGWLRHNQIRKAKSRQA
jgi:superfamily II DNA or RNA helicase